MSKKQLLSSVIAFFFLLFLLAHFSDPVKFRAVELAMPDISVLPAMPEEPCEDSLFHWFLSWLPDFLYHEVPDTAPHADSWLNSVIPAVVSFFVPEPYDILVYPVANALVPVLADLFFYVEEPGTEPEDDPEKPGNPSFPGSLNIAFPDEFDMNFSLPWSGVPRQIGGLELVDYNVISMSIDADNTAYLLLKTLGCDLASPVTTPADLVILVKQFAFAVFIIGFFMRYLLKVMGYFMGGKYTDGR